MREYGDDFYDDYDSIHGDKLEELKDSFENFIDFLYCDEAELDLDEIEYALHFIGMTLGVHLPEKNLMIQKKEFPNAI